MGKGGLTSRGRRWQESGDEDGGLGAARGDGDGARPATGMRRGGLGEARGDGDDEDGGLRDAGDEAGEGSRRRQRWQRQRRWRGGAA